MNRPFNYTISDNFVLTISQISRDLEKISQYTRVMPISSGIKKSCDIRNVQAVLRLSGYTVDRLTEKEYAIRTGNISRAMEFAGTADLSDISACCQLHALLMDGLSSEAGSFRTGRHVRESTPASRVLPSASAIVRHKRENVNGKTVLFKVKDLPVIAYHDYLYDKWHSETFGRSAIPFSQSGRRKSRR